MHEVSAVTMRLFAHPWVRPVFLGVCLAVIAAQAVVVAHRRQTHVGDYDVSREMGRRFLAGEHLYAGGLHYPYTPTAAMSFAPLAMVRPGLGLALRYAAAVGGLWLTLRWLRAMVWKGRRLDPTAVLGVEILTLALGAQYLLRDLDDGGPHLLLLTALVGGIYCVWRGRDGLGAVWFGLTAVLKAPAGLLLAFFLWKRNWKLAGMTAIAALLWTLLPMVWMGPAGWWRHQEEWTLTAVRSVLGDPAPGVRASEERIQNQSLTLAVKRALTAYPDGHPLRPSHPGYASLMGWDPRTARWAALAVALVVVGACAWLTRTPYRGRDDPAWLLECSAVLILALLLSPVTWAQHLVWILPALYLIMTEACAFRGLGAPATVAMWVYTVPALVLNREILGRDLNLLFLGYSMHTLAMLLVLAVILGRRPTAAPGRS